MRTPEQKLKRKYQDRVRRGAEFLDKHHSDWFQEINIQTFCFSSCRNCILGHLFGHFNDQPSDWNLSKHVALGLYKCHTLGFDFVDGLSTSVMHTQWLREIYKRLANN